ncbi:MAG: hypothetical protein DRO87_08050, partial [Candidatus Thorarchaeota archaeon]
MTKESRRRPREQTVSVTATESQQQTMGGKYFCPSSTFLTQKFALNSFTRTIAKKGKGRAPAVRISPSDIQTRLTGRKCNTLDLAALLRSFANFRKAVNQILGKAYSDVSLLDALGTELEECRGKLYTVLRKEQCFKWEHDNEFGKLLYERLHRNALETAARIIYGDYTRRRLVNVLINLIADDERQLLRLMTNRRIPSDIVRRVKDSIKKQSKGSFHYALSACRQVRRVLRLAVQEANHSEGEERRRTAGDLLKEGSAERERTMDILRNTVTTWKRTGFPFVNPVFQKNTVDFAASTENTTTQGYWFQQDPEREDEIILYVKTPPGILGHEQDTPSPYKSQTVRLRFLNWLPRKAARARRKAEEMRRRGKFQRAARLEHRAARFEDMSQQLMNTMDLQRVTRELARERAQPERDQARIEFLKKKVQTLKQARRTAPPTMKNEGTRVNLLIPFQIPDEALLKTTLSTLPSRTSSAGVDRGLRHSMVVSVRNGGSTYEETMIGRQELFKKREALRQQTRTLMSQIALKRNNWEKKHAGLQPPAAILKKERELESVWRKIRRLDREITHQVAAETVWFCENRGVKTIYFEDLRSFQGKGGMGRHSWNLSTNLWGMMIEGVRYRREALGHKNGGIWLVNPAWTSQTCHVCGERG